MLEYILLGGNEFLSAYFNQNCFQIPWWREEIKNIRFLVYLILCHINHTAFKLPDFEIAAAMSRQRVHILSLALIMLIATFSCYSGYSNYCLYPAHCAGNALLLSSRDKWYLQIFDPYSWQLPLLHMSQWPNWTQPTAQNDSYYVSKYQRSLVMSFFVRRSGHVWRHVASLDQWSKVGHSVNSDLNGPKSPRKYLGVCLWYFVS